jgi:hypothetical protein
MKEMLFGDYPQFSTILDTIVELEKEINSNSLDDGQSVL